uniref:Uncharacterized protein n=1 Tax=Knipowitschia caucasica TaxID=637954 RepID=A0AAV2KGV7_KNICA
MEVCQDMVDDGKPGNGSGVEVVGNGGGTDLVGVCVVCVGVVLFVWLLVVWCGVVGVGLVGWLWGGLGVWWLFILGGVVCVWVGCGGRYLGFGLGCVVCLCGLVGVVGCVVGCSCWFWFGVCVGVVVVGWVL